MCEGGSRIADLESGRVRDVHASTVNPDVVMISYAVGDVVMILDNIGRSSSTDSTTSQVGAGARSHDLGDTSVMICLITSIGGSTEG